VKTGKTYSTSSNYKNIEVDDIETAKKKKMQLEEDLDSV